MTVIVLLGPPGAGKGTQAPLVADHLGAPILASGDLLRAAAAAGTSLGREAERYMNRGQLVPDATIVGVFLDRLTQPDAQRGAVLDGFPRTQIQAQALDDALAGTGGASRVRSTSTCRREDVVARMANRRICTAKGHVYNLLSNPPKVEGICDIDGSPLGQRADDEESTVRARMAQQLPPLAEVVDHYRSAGILQSVDGRAAHRGRDARRSRRRGPDPKRSLRW